MMIDIPHSPLNSTTQVCLGRYWYTFSMQDEPSRWIGQKCIRLVKEAAPVANRLMWKDKVGVHVTEGVPPLHERQQDKHRQSESD